MLTLNEATIRFGGLTAVDHVSFTVEKGQIFGVIGPNGAGKTTLFNLVSGVHKLTSGSITFNGKDVGGLEPYQIAEAGIARTYQNINLFSNLTVLENAMIGRHTKSKSGLAAAIFRTPAQKREEAAIREKGTHIGVVAASNLEVYNDMSVYSDEFLFSLDESCIASVPEPTIEERRPIGFFM